MSLIVIMTIIAISSVSTVNAAYLTIGSQGSEVSKLQSWLIDNGFPIPLIENGVAEPGYFGSQTRDAVRMYQESIGEFSSGAIDSSFLSQSKELKLGAVVGPVSYYPVENHNGVQTYFYNQIAKSTGTTTVCSFLLPQATTTLSFASFYASKLASTTDLEIGLASVYDATTTRLVLIGTGAAPLPTGGTVVNIASSTLIAGSYSTTSPRYLNFKLGFNAISGATPATDAVCKAVLVDTQNKN